MCETWNKKPSRPRRPSKCFCSLLWKLPERRGVGVCGQIVKSVQRSHSQRRVLEWHSFSDRLMLSLPVFSLTLILMPAFVSPMKDAVSAATDEERLVKIHDVIQQLPPPHYRFGLIHNFPFSPTPSSLDTQGLRELKYMSCVFNLGAFTVITSPFLSTLMRMTHKVTADNCIAMNFLTFVNSNLFLIFFWDYLFCINSCIIVIYAAIAASCVWSNTHLILGLWSFLCGIFLDWRPSVASLTCTAKTWPLSGRPTC